MVKSGSWKDEWDGMPEYDQRKTEWHCIKVSFNTKEAMEKFSELIGQRVTLQTKIVYYPEKLVESVKGKKYVDESQLPGVHRIEGQSQEQTDEQGSG